MVKEEGTFEYLSNNGNLFQKLMENAGKMEEYADEREIVENIDNTLNPVTNGVVDSTDPEKTNKPKGGKSVLIKQEERETGVVSWKVLTR